jgi:MFS transporter, DHA1 family, inner membrane transport protein
MRLRSAGRRAEERRCSGLLLRLIAMTSRPTVLASIVLGLALLGDSLLYAVLPLHASTFGISLAWTGILLSANRVVRLIVYPFLPRLAALGLRRFTVTASALAALSTVVFAFGSGAGVLLASRIVWGAVFGALSLSTMAYATMLAVDAGKRVGLSLSLRELGPLLSLTVGAAIVATAGVRFALAAVGIISAAGVLVALSLPDLKSAPREHAASVWRRPVSEDWSSAAGGFVADGVFPATAALLLAQSSDVGLAVVGAGILLGLKRIAVVVLAPAGGYAADTFGANIVTSAGFIIAAIGALSIGAGSVLFGVIFLSCGAAVTTTTIPVSVAARNPHERVGALARIGIARDAGAAAGPLAALLLFNAAGPTVLYSSAAVLLLLMAYLSRKPVKLVSGLERQLTGHHG